MANPPHKQLKRASTAFWRRSCRGKVRHQTLETAELHVAELLACRSYTRPPEPYRCCFCDTWHVGRRIPERYQENQRDREESVLRVARMLLVRLLWLRVVSQKRGAPMSTQLSAPQWWKELLDPPAPGRTRGSSIH